MKTLVPLRNGCSIRRAGGDALYPIWESVGSVSCPDRLPPSEEKDRGGVLERNGEASAGVPVLRKPMRTSSSGILTSLVSNG